MKDFKGKQRTGRFGIASWGCICLAVLATFAGCTARVTRGELHDLGYEEFRVSFNAIMKLHQHGKESIPFLIDEISNQKSSTLYSLANPLNSNFNIEGSYDCLGFLYAYIIELILAKETLAEADDFPCCQFLGSEYNCIFWDGVLRFSNGKAVKKGDLNEIEKSYEDWWRRNKHKSLRQLRKDWNKGIVPLDKSGYYWH